MNTNPMKFNNNLEALAGDIQKKAFTRYHTNAIEIPFYLTVEQWEDLSDIFAPQPITYGSKLKRNAHPIPAMMNVWAYNDAKRTASRYAEIDVLEIGPRMENNDKHHGCYRNIDQREASRLENAKLRTNKQIHTHSVLECSYKAKYAFAINVYDILITDIPKIFKHHEITCLDMYMFVPDRLFNDQFRADEKSFKVQTIGTNTRFWFNDGSLGYEHNSENWRAYICTSLIEANNFDLTVETVMNLRSFYKIRFTKIEKKQRCTLFRSLPALNRYEDQVFIPILSRMMDKQWYHIMAANNYLDNCILVQRKYVNRVLEYAGRQVDNTYTFNTLLAYMSSIANTVRIETSDGLRAINEGITEDSADREEIFISLFILGAIARHNRTYNLSRIFKYMKTTPKGTFKNWFKSEYKEFWQKYFGDTMDKEKQKFDIYNIVPIPVSLEFCEDNRKTNSIIITEHQQTELNIPLNFINTPKDNIINIFKEEDIKNINNKLDPYNNNIINVEDEKLYQQLILRYDNHNNITIKYNIKECKKVIYNPKGDGKCGINILNHIMKTPLKYEGIYNKYNTWMYALEMHIEESKSNEETTNHEIEQLITICNYNDISVVIHNEGMVYATNYGSTKTIGINLHAGHYTQVECTHHARKRGGGYILPTVNEVNNQTITDEEWEDIIPNKNDKHMEGKIKELIELFSCFKNKETVITDISCAPGTFLKYLEDNAYKNVTGYCYIGENASKLNKATKTQIQLYNNLRELKINSEVIIADLPCIKEEEYKYIERMEFGHLILKVVAQKENMQKMIRRIFQNYNIVMSRLDNSKNTSSEQYWYITPKGDYSEINVKTITKIQLEGKSKCTCKTTKIEPYNNEIIIPSVDIGIHNAYKENCIINDPVINKITVEQKEKYIMLEHLEEIKIPCILGVGGSGKTRGVFENKCHMHDVIVSPYKELGTKHTSITYMKFLKKIIEGRKYRKVYLDEIFVYSADYIHTLLQYSQIDQIVGIGDQYQLRHIDFNNTNVNNDFKINGKGYNEITKRSPIDVIPYINKMLNKNIKTTSKIKNSMFAKEISDLDNINFTEEVIMCATQKMKEMLSKRHKNVKTIAETHGKTFRSVAFIPHDLTQLPAENQVRYIYVAASRHTHKFVIYGSKTLIEQTYEILGTPIERTLLASTIPVVPEVEVVEKDNIILKHNTIYQDNVHIPDDEIEEILEPLFKYENNNDNPLVAYTSDVLPRVNEGKLRINADVANSKIIKIKGRRIGNKNRVKIAINKDSQYALKTMITRYSKKTNIEGSTELLTKGLFSAFKDDYNSIEKLQKNINIPIEEVWKNSREYLRVLQSKYPEKEIKEQIKRDVAFISGEKYNKNSQDTTTQRFKEMYEIFNYRKATFEFDSSNNVLKKLTELEREYDDAYNDRIAFHLKQQTKPIIKNSSDANDKAGQGVSAWSKMINIFMSGWIRTMNEKIKNIIKDNYILAYDKSDAIISNEFSKYSEYTMNDEYQELNTDFTEFDSSHNMRSIAMERVLMSAMGIHKKVVEKYIKIRTTWELLGYNDGIYALSGKYKQHSGQPNTLGANTMFNIAAINACYDIQGLLYFGAKGDDATIKAKKITERTAETISMQNYLGYNIKAVYGKPTEFICNIMTPYGFYPDVLRRVTKIISTIYVDEKSYELAKINVKDALDVINGKDCNLDIMEKYASEYYRIHKKIIIKPEQIHRMYLWLLQFDKRELERCKEGTFFAVNF
jgi:hypothetical protein